MLPFMSHILILLIYEVKSLYMKYSFEFVYIHIVLICMYMMIFFN